MSFRRKLYIMALAIAGIASILFVLLRFTRTLPDELNWRISAKWRQIISNEMNQPGSILQVDAFVASFMKKYNVPGLSIAIAKDDKLIYTKGYGYADVTTEEKVNTASLFRLCSVSKPFTSAAIMKLL